MKFFNLTIAGKSPWK